jgi:hypothetical protein
VENSPAGFSGEKPNVAGASQGYANDLRNIFYRSDKKYSEKAAARSAPATFPEEGNTTQGSSLRYEKPPTAD